MQKKTSWAWLFACVVGAKSASWRSGVCDANSPTPQFAHIANLSHIAKFIHVANSFTLQFAHVANSSTPQFVSFAPLKLQGQGGAKGVMCRFPDGEHREGGRGLWYSLFYGLGLFSFS